MSAPAQGNQILFGLGRELSEGIRDDSATIRYVKPVLPLNGRFGFAKSPGGEVNQSGFAEKGVPGPITGPIDFGCRMSVPTFFFLLGHMFRDIVKSTLEAGVFQYVCTPDRSIPEQPLFAIFGMPPVDQMYQHGIKLGSISATIGNNTAINSRIQGQGMHFSRLGVGIPQAANTGTWEVQPVTHGPVASEAAGNVHWEITALAPLRFKVKQAAGTTAPTISGSTVLTQRYGPDGDAVFIDVLSDTGAEVGIYDENRDPLRMCFPGTVADHAGFAVGDKGYFPVTWTLPTPTYLTGQRFTSAHQLNQYSIDGGTTWIDLNTLTSTLTVADPLAVDQGSGSRYPFAIDRNGQLVPTLGFTRKVRDRSFRGLYETDDNFKMRTYFNGQLLAGGPHRESIKLDWAGTELLTLADPASNDNAIVETAAIRGVTDDVGTPPLTATLVTDQDYTVV